MARILVIEDDPKLAKLLTSDLELEGYKVLRATDGEQGLDMAKKENPDLIVLDVMLPKMNGYDVCRALRQDGSDVAILMLTAKGHESEKVVGLGMGADDYVTKPFSGLELMARIKALLRRHSREKEKLTAIDIGGIHVDFKKMEAKKGNQSISLTPKEFQLLELLVRNKGEVVTRRRFLEEIWGFEKMPSTRTVDNQVLSLRQKLFGKNDDSQRFIATIHGVGYKFLG